MLTRESIALISEEMGKIHNLIDDVTLIVERATTVIGNTLTEIDHVNSFLEKIDYEAMFNRTVVLSERLESILSHFDSQGIKLSLK